MASWKPASRLRGTTRLRLAAVNDPRQIRQHFAFVTLGVESQRLPLSGPSGKARRMLLKPANRVGQGGWRRLVEKHTRAEPLVIGRQHGFGDAAAAEGDNRRSAGLGL